MSTVTESPFAAAIEAVNERVSSPAVPFDPRTEVSADARFMVRRLVLWLLGVPLIIAGLIYANSAIKEAQRASAAAAEAKVDFYLSMDTASAQMAARLMAAQISNCKSDVEWPISAATKRCIEKAVQTCKSAKLSDAGNHSLLDALCSP